MFKSVPVDDLSSRASPLSPGKSDPGAGEGSSKSLANVLAALPAPPGGLKRKHSTEDPLANFNPPSKLPRPGKKCTFTYNKNNFEFRK